jgi:hypothetical protein
MSEHENEFPIFSTVIDAKNYRSAKYPTIREQCEHAITTLGKKVPDSLYYIVTNTKTYSDPERHEEWLAYIGQFYTKHGKQRM